jgi:hypothetical protein
MLATAALITASCLAENDPPSRDHIRILQEAHIREHARAIRAIPRPRYKLPIARPAPRLSEEERAELKAAIERFVRERAGVLVDIRKAQP